MPTEKRPQAFSGALAKRATRPAAAATKRQGKVETRTYCTGGVCGIPAETPAKCRRYEITAKANSKAPDRKARRPLQKDAPDGHSKSLDGIDDRSARMAEKTEMRMKTPAVATASV